MTSIQATRTPECVRCRALSSPPPLLLLLQVRGMQPELCVALLTRAPGVCGCRVGQGHAAGA